MARSAARAEARQVSGYSKWGLEQAGLAWGWTPGAAWHLCVWEPALALQKIQSLHPRSWAGLAAAHACKRGLENYTSAKVAA